MTEFGDELNYSGSFPAHLQRKLRRPLGTTGRKQRPVGTLGLSYSAFPLPGLCCPWLKSWPCPPAQHKGVIGQLWIYEYFFLFFFLMSLSCINFIKLRIPQVNSKWRKRAACLEDAVIKHWVVKPSTDFKLLFVVSLAFIGDFWLLSANGPSRMRGHGASG